MLKKVVILLLAMILVGGMGMPVKSFASMETLDDSLLFDVIPYWTMIANVSNGLEINASGNAIMVSQITGYSGQVDSIRISSYLQRYQNGSWVAVKNWSQDYQGSSALWSKSWYVNKGYNYRLTTFFYVYGKNGSQESIVLISGVKYY